MSSIRAPVFQASTSYFIMKRYLEFLAFPLLVLFSAGYTLASSQEPKCIMYLTGQHPIGPELKRLASTTHVALAFMRSEIFNTPDATEWPLFTTVEKTRQSFAPGTKILVAVGGWGDTGFSTAAKTHEATATFVKNLARMVQETGADGVDIDWEYPGGNGEDYKAVPNDLKAWEISQYPSFLSSIRHALGSDKLISAAVPGLPRDMLAFTPTTIPRIMESVDFLNVMTYDLMNRRDNVTKHHTGIANSLEAVDAYIERGVPPEKINLGFAFYVKWFRTDPKGACAEGPVGCGTALMEDPKTGADLGQAGAFSWHDEVPSELSASFKRAIRNGVYDEDGGGHYYWDREEQLFWSWDNPAAIKKKFPAIMRRKDLGGVFAWGLGEDGKKWEHLDALTKEFRAWAKSKNLVEDERDEL